MQLNTLGGCAAFVSTQSADAIASQLRVDQSLCRAGGIPSLLCYCVPLKDDAIARALSADAEIPLPIARWRYDSIVRGIKAYLAQMAPHEKPPGDPSEGPIPKHLIPSQADFEAALKVLQYLQLPAQAGTSLALSSPLSEVMCAVQAQLPYGSVPHFDQTPQHPHAFSPAPAVSRRKRVCYICLYVLATPHKFYPSLCVPCGSFNIAESSRSLPGALDLAGKTAVVTGGRINLGFHTALRLLRCGAAVVVTSRYPRDAESRFVAQRDAAQWRDRLRIVGADFRSARDVFKLVEAVVACLDEWRGAKATAKLDILINNAAQTLTDPVETERRNIRGEEKLGSPDGGDGRLLVDNGYSARVRGGVETGLLEAATCTPDVHPIGGGDVDSGGVAAAPPKSSWTQSLREIPYEDVISAHSVNAFVPLILLRELLPHLRSSDPTAAGKRAAAYVLNVSSREALPEATPAHPAKMGRHVHTNMSKAAMHMLTTTEAATCWADHGVAVNSVDPGYMSADPQWERSKTPGWTGVPLGWEDGAGRVLWPVAVGENGEPVWGRFLKHFGDISGRAVR